MDATGRKIAERAIAKGLLSRAVVDACLCESMATGVPLGALLVRRGHLRPAALVDLMEEVGVERAPGPDSPATGRATPPAPPTAPAGPLRVGDPLFASRYHILEEMGRGTAGAIYRARDTKIGRDVAVKALLPDALASPEAVERFHREMRAIALVDHPNIVSIHDIGEHEGVPFYTMPLLRGRLLADAIRSGPLEPRFAVEIARQIAEALEAAHARGIFHRDVKPANIMLEGEGGSVSARLFDFGLAKFEDLGDVSFPKPLTLAGDLLGTPLYASPEQVIDARVADARTDVYSLGATLYHMLTGRVPFEAPSIQELLRKVVFELPPPPSSLRPALDRRIDRICGRCLAKYPRERYPSAAELAADCRRWLESIR